MKTMQEILSQFDQVANDARQAIYEKTKNEEIYLVGECYVRHPDPDYKEMFEVLSVHKGLIHCCISHKSETIDVREIDLQDLFNLLQALDI